MPKNRKDSETEPNRELRRMDHEELIEIIYTLRQEMQILQQENEQLTEQVEDRIIRLDKAGSIAEAALSLNHVFESAQAAADQYLLSVKSNAESEVKAEAEAEDTVSSAKAEAEKILEAARAEADEIIRGSQKHVDEIVPQSQEPANDEIISSAKAEADRILNSARAEADEIIRESQKRADEIIQQSEQKAKETEEKLVKSVTAFFRKNPKLAMEWEKEQKSRRANPEPAVPQEGSNANQYKNLAQNPVQAAGNSG